MSFDNVKAKSLGLGTVAANAYFTIATAATSVNTEVQLKDFQNGNISNNVFLYAYLTDGDSSTLTDTGTVAKWSDVGTWKVVSTTGSQLRTSAANAEAYFPCITCSNGTITFQVGPGNENYFYLHIVSPNGQILSSNIITTSA